MRHLKTVISIVLLSALPYACNDYLNVVPDNVATLDNAFALRNTAEQYLFTVYSYLPDYADFEDNPGLTTGDEIWFFYPPNDFNPRAWEIARGNQNVVNPYLNYWDGGQGGVSMFRALRDANIFLENIGQVPDMNQMEKDKWKAEVKFLKAYYHFWLLRMYGPIPIIKENLPISSGPDEVKVSREPVDETIDYIVSLIDEAAEDLPDVVEFTSTEQGRITKPIALSIKARILAAAASPLFNGNDELSRLQDKDGTPLINPQYDPQKWERAAEAAREAIVLCDSVGMSLQQFVPEILGTNVSDTTALQMDIRTAVTATWNRNKELIWGSTNSMATTIQRFAQARIFVGLAQSGKPRGMYAPPLRMVELFYTENGVPIDEDNTWDYADRYDLRTATQDERYYIKEGYETAVLNFDREPRFYANLGFDGGIWYGHGRLDDNDTYHVENKAGQFAARSETSNYTITGYYPKKLSNYLSEPTQGANFDPEPYPWPVMRLADLYLLYAEALNEVNGPEAETFKWINLVRERAGIPPVQEAWADFSDNPDKPNSKDGLREIIHQERLIELAFEGHRYWDLKRWKKAPRVMNKPIRGWDIEQEEAAAYYRPKVLFDQRLFNEPRDYFWPIREENLVINRNLIQNPGW